MSEEEGIVEATSETEEAAMSRGWAPESDWDGDPDQWVDAPTFVRQGELMDRISSQTKQLKSQDSEIEQLKVAMTSLAETNKKIAESEYKKAIKDLKTQKATALDNDDHLAVIEIDEQLSDLKTAKKEVDELPQEPQPATPTQPDVHPYVDQWMDDNAWYGSDTILSGATDALVAAYLSGNPAAENNPKLVFDHVEKELKKEFPQKFGGRKRPTATADPQTDGSSKAKSSRKTSKFTERHLSPEQKKIAQTIVRTGVMNMQEYVDQLAEIGELG